MPERVLHGVHEDVPGRPYLCNKSKPSKGRNDYTRLPNLPMFKVTCKNCLRVLRCGQQMTLQLQPR